MTTTSTIYVGPAPTKNQILERLFKAEQITFEEMMTLLESNTVFVPQQQTFPNPFQPFYQDTPYKVTCDS